MKGQRDDVSRDEGDVTCVKGEAMRNEEAMHEGGEGGRRGVMKDVTRCRRGKKEGCEGDQQMKKKKVKKVKMNKLAAASSLAFMTEDAACTDSRKVRPPSVCEQEGVPMHL